MNLDRLNALFFFAFLLPSSGDPGDQPGNQKIIQMTEEICRQLSLNYRFYSVGWEDKPWSDECRFNTLSHQIILPQTLMGKLEPEEWRSLLVPSLIMRSKC